VSTAANLRSEWNKVTSNSIVVMNMHSSPTALFAKTGAAAVIPSNFATKTIDTLLLLSCNSAHNNVSGNIVAQFHRSKHTITQIVGTDGGHFRDGGSGTGANIRVTPLFKGSASFKTVNGRRVQRSPHGFELYRNGRFTRHLGLRYSSISALLTSVGR
jgi:hypothetical protein